jgi:iron complex outermembrane recepter protein
VTRDSEGYVIEVNSPTFNAGKMEVQGWDIDVRYRETLGPGILGIGLQGTYYTKFDQTTPGGFVSHKVGTTVDNQGNPVISSTTGLDGYGVILRYKQYMTVNWTQADWSTTLGYSYASGYHSGWDLDGNPTSMPSLSLWDLQVAYTGFQNIVLTLGGRNIFDKQPSTYVSVSNAFQSGYDSSQYDPRGRVVYLTGSFKF